MPKERSQSTKAKLWNIDTSKEGVGTFVTPCSYKTPPVLLVLLSNLGRAVYEEGNASGASLIFFKPCGVLQAKLVIYFKVKHT